MIVAGQLTTTVGGTPVLCCPALALIRNRLRPFVTA